MNDKIYENMQKHGTDLGFYATKDKDAIYLKPYNPDIRTPFFRDIDKIIYSLSYVRYMDKTQVFTVVENDHIQKRMVHVQYVSKIARTIGRALRLNEDLIEAAALGHDLGHTPYGHEGEKVLDKISRELGEGNFLHNINSVRNVMFVENYGNGNNVSLQVLDAIMCHNGEMVSNEYHPKKKNPEDFLKEYFASYEDKDVAKYLRPMTLEGCVVRVSDIIAYLGRDIEDGIRVGLLTFDDVPKEIREVLGTTNSEIVNTIICDIIKNSVDVPYIKMSDEVFNAVKALKQFNYDYIYYKCLDKQQRDYIEFKFRCVVSSFMKDLVNHNTDSVIYKSYLNNMSDEYRENSNARIVLDYVSGMTDEYFNEQFDKLNIKIVE